MATIDPSLERVLSFHVQRAGQAQAMTTETYIAGLQRLVEGSVGEQIKYIVQGGHATEPTHIGDTLCEHATISQGCDPLVVPPGASSGIPLSWAAFVPTFEALAAPTGIGALDAMCGSRSAGIVAADRPRGVYGAIMHRMTQFN